MLLNILHFDVSNANNIFECLTSVFAACKFTISVKNRQTSSMSLLVVSIKLKI